MASSKNIDKSSNFKTAQSNKRDPPDHEHFCIWISIRFVAFITDGYIIYQLLSFVIGRLIFVSAKFAYPSYLIVSIFLIIYFLNAYTYTLS